MAEFERELDRLEVQLAALESGVGGLESVTGAFRREIDGVEVSMKRAGREAAGMSRTVSSSIQKAFGDVVFDGRQLSDALSAAGRSVSSSALQRAVAPVQNAMGSWVGKGVQSVLSSLISPGAGKRSGSVAAFARGGVVSGPTSFPMSSGMGVMGEAGPEAILPLTRGSDGRLGIRSAVGSGTVNVTMNVSTPDVAGFRRSQSQIASEMSRALQRGQRNL